ncbi:MAG TPA: hypothetical protein VEB69_10495 [Acidimicrobiia bacterium]|nr:hypothetical protein [Acidimicrobiia bacterium]
MREMTFEKRFQGPFGSVNGGYLAGVLGDAASSHVSSVRLRRPVPVGEPVYLFADDGWAAIRQCDQTLAETVDASEAVATTEFVPMDEALATDHPRFDLGMFADCFVCGRGGEAGLGVRPRPLADGRFVALWQPSSSGLIEGPLVPKRFLHSALDCPGGFAAIAASGHLAVTGSLTTRIDFLPETDQTLLVVAEATGREGRKLFATTTIFTESGLVAATAEAVWVTLETLSIDPAA